VKVRGGKKSKGRWKLQRKSESIKLLVKREGQEKKKDHLDSMGLGSLGQNAGKTLKRKTVLPTPYKEEDVEKQPALNISNRRKGMKPIGEKQGKGESSTTESFHPEGSTGSSPS